MFAGGTERRIQTGKLGGMHRDFAIDLILRRTAPRPG
jgi:hypothetical protein